VTMVFIVHKFSAETVSWNRIQRSRKRVCARGWRARSRRPRWYLFVSRFLGGGGCLAFLSNFKKLVRISSFFN
jgi:hypothetical protein